MPASDRIDVIYRYISMLQEDAGFEDTDYYSCLQ